MSRCFIDIYHSFIKRSSHILGCMLLLTIGEILFHNSSFLILQLKNNFTIPSSRIILVVVSHLFLRERRGKARWNPVLSKQVIP